MKSKQKESNDKEVCCQICGVVIPEGHPASATTSGTIIDGEFSMDHEVWTTIACEICADQIDYVNGNLNTALASLE